MFLPTRHLDNTRAGGGGTLIVSPRRTTSENALSLQQRSGSKVSPKSSHDRGQVFVTGRCACLCYGRTLGPWFSTESTAPTKKEKRTKKERKTTTTTEFTLSINFGLVNTYKGLGVRGQAHSLIFSRAFRDAPRELGCRLNQQRDIPLTPAPLPRWGEGSPALMPTAGLPALSPTFPA